ncbi:MAG TPA: polysaccharide deacetylase family protein [Gemmatimonadaceae bacterium]|nr:polysaccharide deacetylase family protein [Gemmatimonadaceae bacterium]
MALFFGGARRYIALLVAALLIALVAVLWTAPRWAVPHLAKRFPGCIYTVESSAPVIGLTIDDGPDSSTTPAILRELRDHDAHATFFLISGNVPGNESIVTAMVEEGNEIGNHLTRDEASIGLSPAAFDSALVHAGRVLSGFAPVRWARPGGGRYDRRMLMTMRNRGYECALGSIYPYDAELPSSRLSAAFVLRHARPGAVIVLHDGKARGRRTAAVLHRVLPVLRQRGLRVVTLSELTAPPQRTR